MWRCGVSGFKIAILFAMKDTVYKNMGEIVDIWDAKRDATKYSGNNPVVAHPPCQLWGKFAIINYKRWGGEHNRPRNDGGMFLSALQNVRRCGGVLEHPAFTYAWEEYGLVKPDKGGWKNIGDGEWVCEVWQSSYGHLANKRTWLFYVGRNKPFELHFNKTIAPCQIGFPDQRGKGRNKPTLNKKMANATPVLFAETLVMLAIHSKNKHGWLK